MVFRINIHGVINFKTNVLKLILGQYLSIMGPIRPHYRGVNTPLQGLVGPCSDNYKTPLIGPGGPFGGLWDLFSGTYIKTLVGPVVVVKVPRT